MRSIKKYEKRYQYYGTKGIEWSPWFHCRKEDTLEEWQVKNKLRNEYRVLITKTKTNENNNNRI